MKWVGAYRPPDISLDKGLVMAAWWTVTRSMTSHSVVLGLMIFYIGLTTSNVNNTAYRYIHSWTPLWLWGLLLSGFAVTWVLSRGVTCVVAGVLIMLWFYAFAADFFVVWLSTQNSGTSATGWITYLFLGWSWLLVTYVVWRDERHVKQQMKSLMEIKNQIKEYENGGSSGTSTEE